MFKNNRYFLVTLAIISYSTLLCLPQIISQKAILGSDVLFHYNRFYETAMQIKTGQWHFFMSLFSFEQSGRIINALYGPAFAYFQGLLVLLSKNWLHYQITSRILMGIIAGHSFFYLLKKIKIKTSYALLFSLFYLTTFSIQYWSLKQGFSSWGAAFFPLCLAPAFDVIETGKINRLQLAFSVALMFQVHVLTSVFLVMSYIPFYLYGFFKTKNKLIFIRDGILAVIFFALLTINIWLPLWQLSTQNELLQPFINLNLPQYTINKFSNRLLYEPLPIIILIQSVIASSLLLIRRTSQMSKLSFLVFLLFFGLSSSFIPWEHLVESQNTVVELIQFPFRFFIPATIFLMILSADLLNNYLKPKLLYTTLMLVFLIIGTQQVLLTTTNNIETQFDSDRPIQVRKHMSFEGDTNAIRQAVYDHNKGKLLDLVHKATPDYLPIYRKSATNKYVLYNELVVRVRKQFKKTVKNRKLILEWTAKNTKKRNLPIVLYHNSKLEVNGKQITHQKDKLTTLGTPYVAQKLGKNKAILSYHTPTSFYFALSITAISWLIAGSIFIRKVVSRYFKSY